MALTIDNFLTPMKGNAAFNLNNKISEYKKKYFDKVAKDILVSAVYNKHKETYYFFFKIPSEENDKYPTAIMYDVMLEFSPNKTTSKETAKNMADLKLYDIYAYSNSPSFIFTFDYVMKHRINGFPKSLPFNYLSRVAITKAPKVRNTYEIMTVEKTTWWAFYHLYRNGYLTKEVITSILSKNNENYFIKKMMTQPQKLKEIKDLNDIMKEAKLKEKAAKNANPKTYKKISPVNKDPMTYSFGVANRKPLKTNMTSKIMKRNNLNSKGMFKTNLLFGKKKKK